MFDYSKVAYDMDKAYEFSDYWETHTWGDKLINND